MPSPASEGYVSVAVLKTLSLTFSVAGLLYNAQDYLLFHPDDNQSRVFVHTPSIVDLPFEHVFIRSLDGTLINLYFIGQADGRSASVPTVVFFHGNAGNMGHRLHNAAGLYCHLDCNVLMVEYRGYGLSKGHPTEAGVCMDAQAAIDYLGGRHDVDHKRIVVFGRSLGGAVAIDLAARPEYSAKIWGLILGNTFTSIPDIATALFKWPFLTVLPIFCYKNKFMSKLKIGSVMVPTLFISGLSDSLVPPLMMAELHRRSGSAHKRLATLSAGGHNDTWTCPGYYPTIADFLSEITEYLPATPPVSSSPSVLRSVVTAV
ncbi:hypothetical protein AAG570_004810 [Ranatra chinensis]|uniref:Serine aminopeptidase S33 domain-containing protein n=1 Tax=Ranatra chinensis TaxID=642074 RepID=A0ABD0Y1X5_9HEMI